MREYLSEYKITWGEISPLFRKILQQLEAFIIDNKNKLEKERDNRIASFNSLDTTIRDLQKYDFKENYEKTKEHDIFKTEYCENNNIPLIRIPYTEKNELTMIDLDILTTKFQVC